jgi:hypothetical protein
MPDCATKPPHHTGREAVGSGLENRARSGTGPPRSPENSAPMRGRCSTVMCCPVPCDMPCLVPHKVETTRQNAALCRSQRAPPLVLRQRRLALSASASPGRCIPRNLGGDGRRVEEVAASTMSRVAPVKILDFFRETLRPMATFPGFLIFPPHRLSRSAAGCKGFSKPESQATEISWVVLRSGRGPLGRQTSRSPDHLS